MMSDWPTVKIEDIADVKSGKRLPKDQNLTEQVTPYPYIRLVDIADGRIQDSNLKYLNEETKRIIKRYIVNTNDVCLAIVGHSIGMVFYVEDKWDNANLTENAARITNVEESFNPRFIYYYLTSLEGQNEIIARKVGSAQGKLPLYNIRSLELPKIPRMIQDSIVSTLDSLSFKIELNRQTNQTLEAIAQAIFKSWFVDFDPTRAKIAANECGQARTAGASTEELIAQLLEDGRWTKHQAQTIAQGDPELAAMSAISGQFVSAEANKGDETQEQNPQLTAEKLEELSQTAALFPSVLVDSELGEMPEGWEVTTLGNVTTELRRGISPKYTETDGIQVINQKCIRNHSINFALTRLHDPVKRNVIERQVKLGDVLVNSTGVGTLGRVAPVRFLPEPTVFDSHVTVVRADTNKISKMFLCGLMLEKESFIEASGAGSTGQTELRKQVLEDIDFALPPIGLGRMFEGVVEPMSKQIATLEIQQKSLSESRDALLPKLLSGELELDLGEPS